MEDSSGQLRRLGHITKQGNSLLRFLLVEAAQVTVRSLSEWRSKYCHVALRRGRKPYVESCMRAIHLLVDEGKHDEAEGVIVNETLPAVLKYHA